MPEFEIDCEDKETGQLYKAIVSSSSLEYARIKAVNEGHLVRGLEIRPGSDALKYSPPMSDSQILQGIYENTREIRKFTSFAQVVLIVFVILWVIGTIVSVVLATKR